MGMKKRRHIACLLLFISVVMLIVPVVPHHHHDDGSICMKSDLPAEGCCHQHDDTCAEHCCCDTGCMTTHFFQQVPQSGGDNLLPDFVWVATLFTEPLLRLLLLPDVTDVRQKSVYLESLHGTFVTRAKGLRAPPALPA